MENQPQNRYSKIALIVSLVAFIVALFAGLIKILRGLEAFTPPNPEAYDLALNISAALAVIGVAIYAILEPESVRKFLTGRQARYGSNAFVSILAFTGIIVVANYLVATNADLSALQADLTKDKINTLSPEMVKAMQTLPGQLTATGFFSQTPTDSARELFDKMRAESNGKFEYSFINQDKDPGAAKEAGVTGDGKILLEMNGRREIANYADESEILTALNRIINPEQRTVYFLTGHGEHGIDATDDLALSRARDVLEKKNYAVKTLNLLAEHTIPADAKAIVIAGPRTPLSPEEVDLLNNFAINGGGLVIMEDPLPMTDFGEATDPLAEALKQTWGLNLRNDFVVDTANQSYQNAIGAIFDPQNSITQPLVGQVVVMPLTRSIELQDREGYSLTSLVSTTTDGQTPAWSESDFSPLTSSTNIPQFDQETDVIGPITLAATSLKLDGGVVVVFGTSAFASDLNFDVYANGDLLVNAVAYAAGQESGVDITPKDTTTRTFMPPSQVGSVSILLGSICIIPGLVLGAGIYAWASRRRRG